MPKQASCAFLFCLAIKSALASQFEIVKSHRRSG
jgi:hypothetical protein